MEVPLQIERQAPKISTHNADGTEPSKPRLLDQVRHVIRCKHYSIRTEQAYIEWIKRFIYFHDRRHPGELDKKHISSFLTHLAVERKVASSTQNQALCALIFLYREVIRKEIGRMDDLVRAKRPSKLPVVFTRDEVRGMGHLLYGAGLRLMECLRLRVKDNCRIWKYTWNPPT